MNNPKFTVFTPTFNRRHLLSRPATSLNRQTYRNFEWLVYDDGSTDGTEAYIREISEESLFPINYVWRNNCGKARAINSGVDMARGDWFVVLDSDDWCDENALQRISDEIDRLDQLADGSSYAAISVLKRYADGNVVGDTYGSIKKYGLSYIDRMNLDIKGDKWEIIRTDVHKQFKYELEGDDRYMAPSYAWIRLAAVHKCVFVDEALSTVEYQGDGISANSIVHRLGSRRTTLKYYRFAKSVATSARARFRVESNLARFALHCNERFRVGIIPTISGCALFLRDRFSTR